MKFKGSKTISKLVMMSLAIVSMLGTMVLTNVDVAKADEEIIHTHIWATKYDKDKHWEYCTVCNKVKDECTHKFTDTWELGKETCQKSNGDNFCTKICECGYSYIYRKPHTEDAKWYNTGVRLIHYKKCSSCGDWTRSARCANSTGNLSCKNPGKCDTCGYVATSNCHYLTKNGVCRDCGKKFFTATEPTITYDNDYKTATIKFTFKPEDSSVEFTGTMGAYCGNSNYTDNKWTYVKNSDGSMDYTGVYTFDSSKQRKAKLHFLDRTGAVKINGNNVYTDGNIYTLDIWQDHTAPEVSEVKQVDQKTYNNWATIKELTVSGKEDLSKIVTISILDKQTKDVIVDKAKTNVVNGTYSYKCTPPLEGPETGRAYIAKVEDEIGNVTEKEFVVYRTDCRAPLIRSSKEYTEWSRTKMIAFELTDYGSGTPETSLNDQVSYKKTTKDGDKYKAVYIFADDKYDVSEYALYLRDGLGNATKEVIKVGKIDNTKPTVTDIKGEVVESTLETSGGNTTADNTSATAGTTATATPTMSSNTTTKYAVVTVTANDLNTKLNAEGSGVAGYAVTTTQTLPKDEEWQKDNKLTIKEKGTYYLWVKDLAGNIADITVINVKDDFTIEVQKDKIVYNDTEKVEEINIPAKEEAKESTDKSDKEAMDATPKTADATSIALTVVVLLVSGIAMIVIVNKKRKRA